MTREYLTRKQRAEHEPASRAPAPAPREGGEDTLASLCSSAQAVLGNRAVLGALEGTDEGLGAILADALTLGAAGMAPARDMPGLLGNTFVNEWMAAGPVSRRSEEEGLPHATDPRLRVLRGGGGAPLPSGVRARMEASFGADFSAVRVHVGAEVGRAADALNAEAFAVGTDLFFGQGRFAPGTPSGDHLLAHELTHVVQAQEGRLPSASGPGLDVSSPSDPHEREAERRAAEVVGGVASEGVSGGSEASLAGAHVSSADVSSAGLDASTGIHRKEVREERAIHGDGDWTTADREGNTIRWKKACLFNLNQADSSQYVKIVERRDFYKWFYEYSVKNHFTTRWALAAYVVANGAHQIADMDLDHETANDTFGLANVELQGAMREGNQVIFDNVLPKLLQLKNGGALKGAAALRWDMKVLAEEQSLIQPMYATMSPETREQLDYIARKKRLVWFGAWWTGEDQVAESKGTINAGTVPGFDQPDLQSPADRWRYGMDLGDLFTPGGTGFDPDKDSMPGVGANYRDGSEFARVDTRAHLHQLDAWLNPERLTRTGAGSDIQGIVAALSTFEKQQVLEDRSPDGWSYSTQFAQLDVPETTVRQALPSDPANARAIVLFIANYQAERARRQDEHPHPRPAPMPRR